MHDFPLTHLGNELMAWVYWLQYSSRTAINSNQDDPKHADLKREALENCTLSSSAFIVTDLFSILESSRLDSNCLRVWQVRKVLLGFFLIDKQNLCVMIRAQRIRRRSSGEKRRSALLQFCEEGTFIRHDLHFALHLPGPLSWVFLWIFTQVLQLLGVGNSVECIYLFLHFFYIFHVCRTQQFFIHTNEFTHFRRATLAILYSKLSLEECVRISRSNFHLVV